jgi:parvulin-like peptidyl-prolyl isomerase
MTLRPRTTRPASRVTRFRRLFEGEERQQAVVTVLFLVVIAAVVLILLGAVGLAYYNDNLRPLARVGSVEVGPQFLKDRLELEQWRINLESNRLAQAKIDNQIDAATLSARQSELDQRTQALSTTGLEDLIDLIYQSQLAADEGVTVTDADVDAAVAKVFAGVEKRHVLAIVITPVAAEGADASPTIAERRAALEKAEAALTAVQSGRPWAEVAAEFSSDPSAQTGGDLGNLSQVAVSDADFGEKLFELESGGTTGIVRGADGVYRIGRVMEITAAGEQPGLRDELTKLVPETSLRDLVRYEVTAKELKDKITTAALAETPEQVRIAIISIEGAYSGDALDAQGEVDYSEIVFAPGDDVGVAPLLPAEDPAWEKARVEAQAAFDELNALTGDARKERFAAIATDQSDSDTGQDGGAVGPTTRSIPPQAVGDALFDTPHQPGDLIGPVRADAAWYVLLFNKRQDSPEQRVKAVQDLLAQPGADFAQIAKDKSEGPEAADGGEVGWLTRDQLAAELVDPVFALSPGGVTEPLELQDTHYFIKVEEKANRPPDADQVPDIEAAAFDNWYAPKKDQAKTDGVIVISGETAEATLEPGSDQP